MPTDVFGGIAIYPGTLMLFAENLMEKGVVTVSSEASGSPKELLFDRARGQQWRAVGNGAHAINLDLQAYPRAFSHVALVNIAINTAIDIFTGMTPGTMVQRFITTTIMGNDPYIASLGGLFNDRFVQLNIAGGGVVPALGELFVGVPRIITLPPHIRSSGAAVVGNVHRDRSPSGHEWAVKRGPRRIRLPYAWEGISDADLVELMAAFDEADQGAKTIIVRDELGVARWMSIQTPEVAPVPVGNGLNEVPSFELLEAL